MSNGNPITYGLLCLRILMGMGIMYHGYGKIFGGHMGGFIEGVAALGFPLPAVFAWAAAVSEFVGGLLIVVGLGTRVAAGLVLVTMLVAAFGRHGADPFRDKELALAYGTMALTLIVTGAGAASLDGMLRALLGGEDTE